MANIWIRTKDRTIRWKRQDLPLTRRFYALYCLLAAKRLTNPDQDGFVELAEIQALPEWRKNKLLSVGKQIQRHVERARAQYGIHLIEAKQLTKGPFRLRLAGAEIKLDVPADHLLHHLVCQAAGQLVYSVHERHLYDYVARFWRASAAFEEGSLTEAQKGYRGATNVVLPVVFALLAEHHLAKTLERQGQYDKAARVLLQALSHVQRAGIHRSWIEARLLVMAGWVAYRQRHLDVAESHYRRALDVAAAAVDFLIIGHVWNGLGEIAKERQQYGEALTHYRDALACWTLAEFSYGIQAIYFNVGRLHARWGDQLSLGPFKEQAKAQYRKGLEWIGECIAVCQKLGIGYDISDDEILRASLYRKLGNPVRALKSADQALAASRYAGNMRCLALAYRQKIKILLDSGQRNEADAVLQECQREVPAPFQSLIGKR